MTFYDYIYHRICTWMQPCKDFRPKPEFIAAMLVASLQSLNLSTIGLAVYFYLL